MYALALAPVPSQDDRTTIQATGEGVIEVIWTGSGFNVCGSGKITSDVRVTGIWTLTVSGTGGRTPPPLTSPATSFAACVFVDTGGHPAGTVTGDLSYIGVGTGLIVHSTGFGTWDPVMSGNSATFDFTPERTD